MAAKNFSGTPLPNVWIPDAQANGIVGFDIDPSQPEINAKFNSTFELTGACSSPNCWYMGTDGHPAPNQFDLMSVVLHEVAHGLGPAEMAMWFGRPDPMSFLELREQLSRAHGRLLSAIRISVGVATTFADVFRFLCFLQGFVDRTAEEIEDPHFPGGPA